MNNANKPSNPTVMATKECAVDTDVIEELDFTVTGVPVAQGSMSLFNGRIIDQKVSALRPWRRTIQHAAKTVLAGRPGFGDDPICVSVDFFLPRPKTVTRPRPCVKPDIDKLVRAVFDALTYAHVWADDSRVVMLRAAKFYADDQPGVRVKLGRLTQPVGRAS
jgi:Holliday junction resolvase RusA-like endonuclease